VVGVTNVAGCSRQQHRAAGTAGDLICVIWVTSVAVSQLTMHLHTRHATGQGCSWQAVQHERILLLFCCWAVVQGLSCCTTAGDS
jgi:hypothetical protein